MTETPDITDKAVINYINAKYQPADSRLVPFRKVCEHAKVPVIRKEAESLMATLLELKKPARILEIGTALGYSACFFAYKCPKAHVFTIEKDEKTYMAACSNVKNAGLEDRIHLYQGDGEEVTDRIAESGMKFDFIFIDAAKSHYERFMDSALKCAADGAMIISDNILQGGMTLLDSELPENRKHRSNIRKMNAYVDRICSDERMDTCLVSTGDGMAVTILKGRDE
ncbi:MAG: O-methyltransferase [Eubacteriales bacterium]|nr:O-methyltransferase [Eubacteriales bacterium]